MPSPLGHALGGAIVGTVSAAPFETRRFALTCAVVACLPDLDFLWGRHSMETHSLGAALIAGLVALALTRGRDARLALAVTVAWGSHVLFDWLGSDTTPPLGVMALWPFSSEYYFANAFFFDAITRRYWHDGFWRDNILAVVSELVILAPVLVLALWLKRQVGPKPGRRG